MTTSAIRRGDIYLVSLDPVIGSEEGKTRPCVIIQNNIANTNSPVTIIACVTSKPRKKKYPQDVYVSATETGLDRDSIVLLNQIRTVDKRRLIRKIGTIPHYKLQAIDEALRISLHL